ncbi:MAG: hypothetical protein RLZZ245_986 [Verrucomicrobiota bacterium]|jgi:hypothetical protein
MLDTVENLIKAPSFCHSSRQVLTKICPFDRVRPQFMIAVLAIYPGIGQVHPASARVYLICGDFFRCMVQLLST